MCASLANPARGSEPHPSHDAFPVSESLPVDESLEREIRRLYSRFFAPVDRQGRAFVPLADTYRRAGDLQRAKLLLEEGLRRHPDFASAHVVAMRIARDVGDHSGALAATQRVLELDPDNLEARGVLAKVAPLARDAGNRAERDPMGEGDAEAPEESWMVGDAGAWVAGADSGLASVDPVALEAEEARKTVAGGAEEVAAAGITEREPPPGTPAEPGAAKAEPPPGMPAEPGAAKAEPPAVDPAGPEPATGAPTVLGAAKSEPPSAVGPREERAKQVEGEEAVGGARGAAVPVATSAGASAGRDAGIYTRTLARLYEQQGLHAQAIMVYERLVEWEPGDEALARNLKRLRREASGQAPERALAARASSGDAPRLDPVGAAAPPDPVRPATEGDGRGGVTEREARRAKPAEDPGGVPAPGGGPPVVPIEALAPASASRARRGTP